MSATAEKKINWNAVLEFFTQQKILEQFHEYIASVGGVPMDKTHGRPSIVRRLGTYKDTSLDQLKLTLKEDPKALCPKGELPKLEVVQYMEPTFKVGEKGIEVHYKLVVIKDQISLWAAIMEAEKESIPDLTESMRISAFPLKYLVGEEYKNKDCEGAEGWSLLFKTLRELGWSDKPVYNPIYITDELTNIKPKPVVKTMTAYASDCGVTPDKMHMIEKWIAEKVAKASKTWDCVILRGNAIKDAYFMAVGYASCMTSTKCALTEMYCVNPDKVGMVIAAPDLSRKGIDLKKEVCRALIWTTEGGDIVLDRVYPEGNNIDPNQQAKVLLAVQAMFEDKKVYTLYTGPNKTPKSKSDLCIVKIPQCGWTPYLDTYCLAWSPLDDRAFCAKHGIKASQLLAHVESLDNCSRIAYLATDPEAIAKHVSKVLGKTVTPGELSIQTARQQGTGPYVAFREGTDDVKHGGKTRTPEELFKAGTEFVNPNPPTTCILDSVLNPKAKVEKEETYTVTFSNKASASSLMRNPVAAGVLAFDDMEAWMGGAD